MLWDLALQPNLLKCSLLEDRLLTEIQFKTVARKKYEGSIDSYFLKADGKKRFVSHRDLFNLSYAEGIITGLWGDPRAIVETFSFVRKSTNNTGPWLFTLTDQYGRSVRVEFNCIYKRETTDQTGADQAPPSADPNPSR